MKEGSCSWHKQKLVRIEQRAAERGEAVGVDGGRGVGEFFRGGSAAQRELPGAADLLREVVAGFPLHAGGEGFGGVEGEAAVEEVERLNRRRALAAAGGALAGVGAVERAEDGFAFAADFVGVDHPAQPVAGKGLDGLEAAQAAALVFIFENNL